jgi:hypothetical protein
MTIEYWGALVRSWGRMKVLLFRPFSVGKWLILAFCAWVASMPEGSGGGGGGGPKGGVGWSGPVDVRAAMEVLRHIWGRVAEAWHWVLSHWGATLVVFLGIPLLIALLLAIVWVSSRFRLIYLDNLVQGRAEVREPWTRLAHLGDSLWLFRVGFALAVFAIGAALFGLMLALGVVSFTAESRGASVVGLVVVGLLGAIFGVAAIYASLFLNSFVVPIMYRHNLSAMAAWRVFLPWLSAQPASFFLYGLFVLLLFVGAGMAICAAGMVTCCIGFLLLAIPYLGTVVLLPLLVAYRYLSLEFLAQFDPGLNVFAARA